MGIKFYCPNGHKLNVKSFLSGKKAICPKCGIKVMVPSESVEPDDGQTAAGAATSPDIELDVPLPASAASPLPAAPRPSVPAQGTAANPAPAPMAAPAAMPARQPMGAAPMRDAIDEAPGAKWYVRPPSGGQFGPAAGDMMRSWIAEGRVTADSLVWREGWPEWRSAVTTFPQLAGRGAAPAAPVAAAPMAAAPFPTMQPTAAPAPWGGAVPQAAPMGSVPMGMSPMGAPVGAPMGTPLGAHMGAPYGAPMGQPMGAPVGAVVTAPLGLPVGQVAGGMAPGMAGFGDAELEDPTMRRRRRRRKSNNVTMTVTIILIVLMFVLAIVLILVLNNQPEDVPPQNTTPRLSRATSLLSDERTMKQPTFTGGLSFVSFAVSLLCVTANAGAADGPHRFTVADGQLKFTAPESWTPKKPDNNIIEHEFTVTAAEGDPASGRVTVMGAGGSIHQNIERWFGQFTQPDGSNTKDKVKVKKITVDGEEVHVIDISGTFKDQRGPFSATPAVEREKYRMLAAIVATKKQGNYFIKFYGPQRTVSDNESQFMKLVESLEHK